MKTSIIIPNMNGAEHLKKCLPSLIRQTNRDFEVILVDNGSTDDSVNFASIYIDSLKLRVIENETNQGFSKAVNEGIRLSQAEYVLLLNNDTIAGRHMVERLVQVLDEDSSVFSAQALMLQMQDPHKVDSAGDYFSAMGWAFSGGKDRAAAQYKEPTEVFSCCAGAALYRRAVFEQIGLFDENFFAYLEDVDVGYRARLIGYRNLLIPRARVLHVGSATSGSRHNAFKVETSARNSVYVCYKNMTNAQLGLHALPICGGALMKMGYFATKGLGSSYVKGLVSGIKGVTKSGFMDRSHLKKTNSATLRKLEGELIENTIRRFLP